MKDGTIRVQRDGVSAATAGLCREDREFVRHPLRRLRRAFRACRAT